MPALRRAGCSTSTGALQSAVRASWAEGRDTERDVTGGVGMSPPQAPPSRIQGAVPGRSLPRSCPLDTRERDWWRTQGPVLGGLAAGSPPASSHLLQHLCTPWHPHAQQLPGVSQAAVKDLPGVDGRPCGQLVAGLPVGGRQGPRAGSGGPPRSPPARAGAEVAAAHGCAGTGRRAGPALGSAAAQDTDGKRLLSALVHRVHVRRRGAETLGSAGRQELSDRAQAWAAASPALTAAPAQGCWRPQGSPGA